VRRGLRVSAVLVLALTSACGPQAPKSTATKSPPTLTSAAATATESATPTDSTAGSPAPQGLSCRLPVAAANDAGWVTFPAGTFQSDPKAKVSLPHGSSFPLSRSYDKAFERWLPVARDDISPDGKHYAYADVPAVDNSPVHVVDLPSGSNHAFNPGTPPTDGSWIVIDYETEGVYLAVQPNGPAPPTGLWLLDPSTSAVNKVTAAIQAQYISSGAAWSTAEPLTGHDAGPGSRLLRTDLKTAAMGSWYKRTDAEFTVAGADGSGHPILQVWKYQSPQLLLITAANSATILLPAPGSAVPSLGNVIHPVADTHGIWFGDTGGSISLYTPATGVKKMAQVGSGEVTAAGGCH
jgi:hypothetical protein